MRLMIWAVGVCALGGGCSDRPSDSADASADAAAPDVGTTFTLELTGKSGDEAARLIATKLCERELRCGKPSIKCASGASSGGMTTSMCTGTITPSDASRCFDDVYGDLRKILACKPITADEEQLLRACFEPWISQACVTMEQVAEAAKTAETTGTTPSLTPRPPVCTIIVAELAGRCS